VIFIFLRKEQEKKKAEIKANKMTKSLMEIAERKNKERLYYKRRSNNAKQSECCCK
jgi:hypothetical protein